MAPWILISFRLTKLQSNCNLKIPLNIIFTLGSFPLSSYFIRTLHTELNTSLKYIIHTIVVERTQEPVYSEQWIVNSKHRKEAIEPLLVILIGLNYLLSTIYWLLFEPGLFFALDKEVFTVLWQWGCWQTKQMMI